MADNILNKLFVLVKEGTYTDVQNIVNASKTNAKIYFVEDRNEIITKGKQYGASPETLERIKDVEDAIGVLNGDATVAGSVDKKIADAVAAVVSAAPEAFDTLQEIAEWIAGTDGEVAKTAEQLIVAVGDQAHTNDEGEEVASTGLYKYAEDQAAAALASANNAISELDYDGGDAAAGKYVSIVTQADGKISASYTELPSATDTAIEGQYVSAVSQDKGKITVTRAALPTLSVAADSDNFAGVSGHEISIKTKEITGTGAAFAEGTMTASAYAAEAGLATATDVAAKLNAESTTVASAINSLDGRIDSLEALKHTIVNPKADGHVTVAVTDENVVTISENDIASKTALDTLTGVVGKSTDATNVDTVYGKVNKNAADIATLNGGVGEAGSVAKSINDAILGLDATVGSQTIAEGKHVAVEVVETDGKLSGLTVVENDIASKAAIEKSISDEKSRAEGAEKALSDRLDIVEGEATVEGSIKKAVADEKSRAEGAEKALADRLDIIEGEAEGSIKKAVADAKSAIEGTLAEGDAKTLAALNDKIEAVSGAAKSYELRAVTVADSNVKEAYALFDEDDVQAGVAIKIYKDSALQSAALGKAVVTEGKGEEDCLILTYLDVNGNEQVVNIPLGDFLRESEFGNGLAVSADGVVSVKRDETSEAFLSVSADGVKLAGVQDAIDAVANALDGRLDIIEGEGEGSIKKAVADEKSRAEGKEGELQTAIGTEKGRAEAAEKAINDKIGAVPADKTVVGMIEEAKNAAIASGTVVTLAQGVDKITLSSEEDTTNGHVIYTIGQNDIASASELSTLSWVVGTAGDNAGASTLYGTIKQEIADREALANKVGTVPEGSATVIDYINTKSAAVKDIIDGLDASVNFAGNLITGTATQVDGKITAITLDDSKVASKSELTTAIEGLDANITSTGGSKVSVNIVETDGILTGATVTETDIASAAALQALDEYVGKFTAVGTEKTVVGYVDAKTAAAEAAAKKYVDEYDFWETYQA